MYEIERRVIKLYDDFILRSIPLEKRIDKLIFRGKLSFRPSLYLLLLARKNVRDGMRDGISLYPVHRL